MSEEISKIVDELSRKLSREMAKKQEELIANSVSRHLGNKDWKLRDILPRMRRLKYTDGPQEVWLLDDNMLIEIWPMTYEPSAEGRFKAQVRFRYHPKPK